MRGCLGKKRTRPKQNNMKEGCEGALRIKDYYTNDLHNVMPIGKITIVVNRALNVENIIGA